MAERPERFTFNSREIQKQIVTEGVIWEGVVWELNDHCHDLVMWFNTEQEACATLEFVCEYAERHGDINFMAFPILWTIRLILACKMELENAKSTTNWETE